MLMASAKSAPSPQSPSPAPVSEHGFSRAKSPFPQDEMLHNSDTEKPCARHVPKSASGTELVMPALPVPEASQFIPPGQDPLLTPLSRKDIFSSKTPTEASGPENSTDTDAEGSIPRRSKSKRSSSASNDAFFERDRFRARFRTFNHTADDHGAEASSSEQTFSPDSGPEKLSAVCEFEDISTKTKKLDLKTPMASDTPSDYHSDKGHACEHTGHGKHHKSHGKHRKSHKFEQKSPAAPEKSHVTFELPPSRQHKGASTKTINSGSAIELAYPRKENISPLAKESSIFSHFPVIDAPLTLRYISVPELSKVFDWYFNKPLPSTCHMFPWLHGIHAENFAQRAFFSRSAKDCDPTTRPTGARFLMCVETSSAKPRMPRLVRNTVSIDELLCKVEYSKMEVIEQTKEVVMMLKQSQNLQDLDDPEDKLVDILVADALSTGFTPRFLDTDPERGISLRNFHIQVNKVARCADFVVYCAEPRHETCKCSSIGRLLRVAQLLEASLQKRSLTSVDARDVPDFNVFVLNWQKSHFEDYPDVFTVRDCSAIFSSQDGVKKTQLLLYSMILLKSDTFSAWDADFLVKEKVENTKMSAATRLHLNVWSGNMWDHQIMVHMLKGSSDLYADFTPEIKGSSQKHIYCDPGSSSVANTNPWGPKLVSSLPPPRSNWQLFFHCHNDAAFPEQSLLAELLFQYTITSRKAADVTDVHHLEFPSSGSVGLGDCRPENLMSIVNSCKLLYLYSSSVAEDSLAALIYCSDGYTESSLLVLCYIMYAENIPLEAAMLKLHLDYGRPFYIFSTDVQVLRKLEILLRRYSPARLGASSVEWSQLETITNQEISEILLYSPGSAGAQSIPRKLKLGYIASDSESSSDSDSDDDEGAREAMADRKWVEDVDGSLPSRILPYLYLGSLKHANNPVLLSKLGITKVISVGEQLDWLAGYKFLEKHTVVREELYDGDIEMISITPKGPSKLSVTSVMKVNNLQDDGIDELSRALPRVLDYIDEEYQKDKEHARILVHCRVGVSRSATVVIAEVMRRLNLNLPKAYLYVRVRRLNIVIQPNLRFMYELFKWEERVRDKGRGSLRVVDWFVMCQEIKKLNLPFLRK